MTTYTGIMIAMAVGFVGTSVIHLSKGIMKHGVSLLRGAGAKRSSSSAIYAVGVAMNFTNPLWVVIANRFAPTVYYTSMYGLGLVSLLIFSRLALNERTTQRRLVGALLVVAGTLVVGAGRIVAPVAGMHLANRNTVLIIAGAWAIAAPLVAIVSKRTAVSVQELLFGVFGGGLAALEAVMKGVAQAGAEGSTFLPQTPINWWIFIVSFLGAAGAFGMIQWSYFRHCRVSMMATAYNVAYVTVPLVVVAIAIPGETIGLIPLAGLGLLAVGAVVMQIPARLSRRES
ncbi:MAG: hypothetical protein EA426_20175 [Spirochaetaceae bacterium]|nr:MAG: hypothetical protein EA426_20175 [Spirochaetaceae bacterium]